MKNKSTNKQMLFNNKILDILNELEQEINRVDQEDAEFRKVVIESNNHRVGEYNNQIEKIQQLNYRIAKLEKIIDQIVWQSNQSIWHRIINKLRG